MAALMSRIESAEARLGIGLHRLIIFACEKLGDFESKKAPYGAVIVATGVPRDSKKEDSK